MNILAIDTSLDACALALLRGGEVVFQSVDVMERGQAEALAPLAKRAFTATNLAPRALDRIVVTVGPGSFTGVRAGLAFARGLAVALNIDCIGVSTLEALTLGEAENLRASVIATPAALYAALYGAEKTLIAPRRFDTMPAAAAAVSGAAAGASVAVAGPGREELARLAPAARATGAARPDPVLMALRCAGRDPTANPPAPLYLRAALEP